MKFRHEHSIGVSIAGVEHGNLANRVEQIDEYFIGGKIARGGPKRWLQQQPREWNVGDACNAALCVTIEHPSPSPHDNRDGIFLTHGRYFLYRVYGFTSGLTIGAKTAPPPPAFRPLSLRSAENRTIVILVSLS